MSAPEDLPARSAFQMRAGTLALSLSLILASLAPRAAEAIRPTEGDGWSGNGYQKGIKVHSYPSKAGHFRVHYTMEGEDAVSTVDEDPADGVPDFVQRAAEVGEVAWKGYIDEMGFRKPVDDEIFHATADFGGDNRVDIYLVDLGLKADGYLVTELCLKPSYARCAGYLVVENDFQGYSYWDDLTALQTLVPHEFFHLLQAAYSHGQKQWWSEGTAVWGQKKIYPKTKDLEGFLPAFFAEIDSPLNYVKAGVPTDSRTYGAAIFAIFLEEHFDLKSIRETWEGCANEVSEIDAIDAVTTLLEEKYNTDLYTAFATFSRWNLLTGSRALQGQGYAKAATYPEAKLQALGGGLPVTMSNKLARLSAHFFARPAATQNQPLRLRLLTAEPKEMRVEVLAVMGNTMAPQPLDFSDIKGGVEAVFTAPAEATIYIILSTGKRTGPKSKYTLELTQPPPKPSEIDAGSQEQDGGATIAPADGGAQDGIAAQDGGGPPASTVPGGSGSEGGCSASTRGEPTGTTQGLPYAIIFLGTLIWLQRRRKCPLTAQ